MKICRLLFLMLGVAAAAAPAWAQVRVTKGAGEKSTLNIAGFAAGTSGGAAAFRRTLESDLMRSGWFAVVRGGAAEFVLQGAAQDGGDSVEVECKVFDAATRGTVYGKSYSHAASAAQALAHKVADEIVFAVTGRKGFFSARMVLVGTRTKAKELYLCDSDGQNLRQLTNDKTVSMAPQWAPDGRRISYTSYKSQFPDVYVVDMESGARSRIAAYPGLNTGGAFSPDGRNVALILSKDGNPDLYVKNLDSSQLTRLTATPRAAEASPSWSPDGNRIVYVSDQSGTPQLYLVSRAGGQPKRLTSRGSQNVAPDWGANGFIAYSSLMGRFQVCIIHPDTLEGKVVTPGDASYEDPSWAPDGRRLACARTQQYRSGIYLLDSMGDPPIALTESSGDWYSPAWSPR